MRPLLFVLFAPVMLAAPRPDFTGEWRLVPSRSQFAQQQPPQSRVLQIDHRDPVLILRTVEASNGREVDGTHFHSTDGVERTNDVLGNPMKARTYWEGDVLEMRTAGKFGANDISLTDRYEISADGAALTLRRHFEGASPQGPMPAQDQVLVHERVPLRAGAAKVEITPSGSLPMYGYANRACGPSNGVHDPLMAKVLVLESALTRAAVVTLDLGSMVSDNLHREVATKLKIPVLLLAASHTHSGPLFLPSSQTPASLAGQTAGAPAYREQMEKKVFDAIERASRSMFEARLRTGRGALQLGYNRLVKREHGRARAVFDNLERVPYGPVDPEFQLLEVTDASGNAKALLVHYAVHPVVLGPSNCKYSADYPGAMQAAIEAAVPGLQAMFVQGGAGDINPLFLGRAKDEEKDFAQVDRMGKLLAAEVLKARASMQPVTQTSLPLQARTASMRFGDRWEKERTHEIGIVTVLIGRQIAIATIPGEPMHKLQTMWKEQADVPFPLFYGYTYANGGVWAGYVPDIRTAAYGGYGGDSTVTRLEVGAGERMMQQHLIHLFGLRGMWLSAPGAP
jgi:hypothetical protein